MIPQSLFALEEVLIPTFRTDVSPCRLSLEVLELPGKEMALVNAHYNGSQVPTLSSASKKKNIRKPNQSLLRQMV